MTVRHGIGRTWLLVACLLLLPLQRAAAQQVSLLSYGTDRGLSNAGFTCLDQDRTGYLLACTDNGLFRFDGQSFLRYDGASGLPDRGVSHDLQIAPDGTTFVVDAGRLYAAPDQPTRFFTPVAGPNQADGDGSTRSALIGNDMVLTASGTLWIVTRRQNGSEQARHLLSDLQLQRDPALRSITGMTVDGDTLWLGCADGRLCRLECPLQPGASTERRCSEPVVFGPEHGLPAQSWVALMVDRDGTLWARSADHLLSLPRGDNTITVETVPGGVGRYAGRVFRLILAQGPDGQIVTQGPAGLLIRQKTGWTQISRDRGLIDGEIGAILFDRQGSLWLGLRGQGLFRVVGLGRWENWTTTEGLSDNLCWQMARHPGGPLWVATDKGVDAIGEAGRPDVAASTLDGPTFAIAVGSNAQLWSANLSGLLRRSSSTNGRIDASFPVGVSDMMAFDHAGGLLLAARDGLFRVRDPQADAPSSPARVPGTQGRIRVFAQDAEGSIWLVSDNTLLKLDPSGKRPPEVVMRRFGRRPRAMLFVAPDALWIGSDEAGLEQLTLSHGLPARLATIESPSLASSQISSIAQDRRGWVWIGSDHGLDVWNGSTWRQLGTEDGLLSNDLNEGSILADPDGTMWFGTGHGLSHLLDTSDVFSTEPLHPVISRLLLNGAPLVGRSIPWSRARLTVGFSDLDYAFADTVRFRYHLEGVDRDWVETRDTTVRYPTLPSGKLVFSVQAIDPAHHRSSDPVSFTLTVRSPWWATFWFRSLALLTVLAMVTAAWRLRVRLLLSQRRQLEALVAIRTAEIEEAHAALKAQSRLDSLTNLLNRAAITATLEELLQQPDKREQVAVAVADLDHFKSINDRYGHFGGDAVLQQLSSRLTSALQHGEFAGRYGGEEFVLVLSGSMPALQRLQQIRGAMLNGPFWPDHEEIAVSCSFGLTTFRDGDDGETLLRRADRLLYRAKNTGRDRIIAD